MCHSSMFHVHYLIWASKRISWVEAAAQWHSAGLACARSWVQWPAPSGKKKKKKEKSSVLQKGQVPWKFGTTYSRLPRLLRFPPELTLLVEKTHLHLLLCSQRPLQLLALGTGFSSGFSMPLNNHIWRKVKLLLISNYQLIWRSLTSVWIYYANLGT